MKKHLHVVGHWHGCDECQPIREPDLWRYVDSAIDLYVYCPECGAILHRAKLLKRAQDRAKREAAKKKQSHDDFLRLTDSFLAEHYGIMATKIWLGCLERGEFPRLIDIKKEP